ncbi:MAG: Asp-tRNA(Asn)/Glu-tRNA(Gln) amidotransferase subunit GatB [bacterium]
MSQKTYYTTIGLEIHAEVKTKTKMFCSCKNDPDEERPNVNICPICLGHPGTLPRPNKEAIKQVLRVGKAVGGKLALDYTEFDRKNYFYPDIPKGYQLSQYKYPLVSGGNLNGVQLTRVHIEEDTGTSLHEEGQGEDQYSLLNYNRSSVPLMELVTEPVITTAKQASDFAKEFQLLLRTLKASEANLEKGEMRVEANISISPDPKVFGTKVEVKNLNSFKAVEKAIEYEVKRHELLLEKGEKITQETRGWDENKGSTFSQRKKEDAHDYRYFPDPDIPKLKLGELSGFSESELENSLPELPWEKRKRFLALKIKEEQVETLLSRPDIEELFDKIVSKFGGNEGVIVISANYLTTDVVALKEKGGNIPDAENLAKLMIMISENKLSSRGAKDILAIMMNEGGDPEKIAEEKKLIQVSDTGAIKEIVLKIISNNPNVVSEYKAGKASSLQFLIGQAMKETKGAANPKMLQEIFSENLK